MFADALLMVIAQALRIPGVMLGVMESRGVI
jgi:hypothetical protein